MLDVHSYDEHGRSLNSFECDDFSNIICIMYWCFAPANIFPCSRLLYNPHVGQQIFQGAPCHIFSQDFIVCVPVEHIRTLRRSWSLRILTWLPQFTQQHITPRRYVSITTTLLHRHHKVRYCEFDFLNVSVTLQSKLATTFDIQMLA